MTRSRDEVVEPHRNCRASSIAHIINYNNIVFSTVFRGA
ncbi:Protein of unknown function [Pyronema omphalodes CBS 100304]|uniref:Uncharacterized protein n=1 Tax=Pyronema omphalodes (strain CBS 100304) TaxID=1076935 RepID=U4L4F1_PYROM|nr:Protein of unknown function [Pyronema omphalodes CBS 100304]